MLLDLDSTLFGTYGNQEGEGFNFHYQARGYHPLLCYDGLTGELLKAELRNGTLHCSNDADKFMEPLFQVYLKRGIKTYPNCRFPTNPETVKDKSSSCKSVSLTNWNLGVLFKFLNLYSPNNEILFLYYLKRFFLKSKTMNHIIFG